MELSVLESSTSPTSSSVIAAKGSLVITDDGRADVCVLQEDWTSGMDEVKIIWKDLPQYDGVESIKTNELMRPDPDLAGGGGSDGGTPNRLKRRRRCVVSAKDQFVSMNDIRNHYSSSGFDDVTAGDKSRKRSNDKRRAPSTSPQIRQITVTSPKKIMITPSIAKKKKKTEVTTIRRRRRTVQEHDDDHDAVSSHSDPADADAAMTSTTDVVEKYSITSVDGYYEGLSDDERNRWLPVTAREQRYALTLSPKETSSMNRRIIKSFSEPPYMPFHEHDGDSDDEQDMDHLMDEYSPRSVLDDAPLVHNKGTRLVLTEQNIKRTLIMINNNESERNKRKCRS